METITVPTKSVFANKISTESTANASSQSPVEATHTGTVPDVNVTLDSSKEMESVFRSLIRSHNAHQTQSSTVSPVLAPLDFMKFQDSTAKDALMDKFGMAQNALGVPLAQADMSGMINTEDVTQSPFNAHQTLNGMELCVYAILDCIWQVICVSVVQKTLLGTERTATLKFQ